MIDSMVDLKTLMEELLKRYTEGINSDPCQIRQVTLRAESITRHSSLIHLGKHKSFDVPQQIRGNWLKIECPDGIYPNAIAENFFHEIDQIILKEKHKND